MPVANRTDRTSRRVEVELGPRAVVYLETSFPGKFVARGHLSGNKKVVGYSSTLFLFPNIFPAPEGNLPVYTTCAQTLRVPHTSQTTGFNIS